MKTKTAAVQKKTKKGKIAKNSRKKINSNRKKRAKFAIFLLSMNLALQFKKVKKQIVASSFDD